MIDLNQLAVAAVRLADAGLPGVESGTGGIARPRAVAGQPSGLLRTR